MEIARVSLLLLLALLVAGAAGQREGAASVEGAAGLVEGNELLNLYGPELAEDEVLAMGLDEMADMLGPQDGDADEAPAAQRAESAEGEQVKGEEAKDQQAKGEQAEGEQAKGEEAKAEPAKDEEAKTEPAKAEPAEGEQAKAGPLEGEQAATEPAASAEEASTEEAVTEPAPWQEPRNELTLVRFFHGRYYQGQYGNINNVLVREVDSSSLEPNMAYVFEWLEREKKRGVSLFNRATVEALEQLAALAMLTVGKRCNRDSYAILFKNDRATKGRTHKAPSKLGPLRRIETIVHQLSMRHALDCFNVYPEKFNVLRFMELDQESRRSVESFMDGIVGDASATISKVNAVKGKKAAALAYNAISMMGADDPDLRYLGKVVDERRGKMWVDGERVRRLVKKYIVQPCQDYVRTMGPDVFLPARFDAIMMEVEDKYAANSRLVAEFMHGWIHYRLCELLIKRDELPLTKHLVQYINEITK